MKGIGIQTAGLSSSLKLMSAVIIILLLWAGSSSAQLPVCLAPGNTVLTVSCELDQDWTVTAGESGYIIGYDGVVIDGKGFSLTGDVANATCTCGALSPWNSHSGVVNMEFDDVVINDLEIQGFCTGIAAGNGTEVVNNMTVTGCLIYDCGDSGYTTQNARSGRPTLG